MDGDNVRILLQFLQPSFIHYGLVDVGMRHNNEDLVAVHDVP